MTMLASTIGTVPTEGFSWYIVLLDCPFGDPIHEQIDKYFITLGKEAGPDVLVHSRCGKNDQRYAREGPIICKSPLT